MSETRPASKVSTLRIILSLLTAFAVGVLAFGVFKLYFSFFSFDEDVYAMVAYHWKSKFAYESLKKPWPFMKKNTWDTKNKELDDFINKVQGPVKENNIITTLNDKELLLDFFPEHLPRTPEYNLYTVSFDWNEKVFYPFRKMIVNLSLKNDKKNSETVEEFLNTNKSILAKEKNIKKKLPPQLYWDLPKFILKDYDYSKESFYLELKPTIKALYELLKYLDTAPKDQKILNNTKEDNNKIIDLTFDLFKTMDIKHREQDGDKVKISDLEKKHVLLFWKNLGSASSTPFESFIYSRLFFIFHFHTTSIERHEVDDPKKKGEKKMASPAETQEKRHKDFTEMMVKAFKHPDDCKKPNFFKNFFLPTMEEKLKLEKEKTDKYLELLNVV
ncbi:hypothetical protein M153_57350001210 [Pseudoloma neurophilia]|uniref:Uncharacterized protein n=1 Tax=Pseudoloma neurophilia TaxID=146866 RepID=A0A0R0LYI6_9MICR|nr:hypothetical protein M153_57350001210 [Pseudoloma neurophilia]